MKGLFYFRLCNSPATPGPNKERRSHPLLERRGFSRASSMTTKKERWGDYGVSYEAVRRGLHTARRG